MSHSTEFEVQFWGVRGSIATPGLSTVRYGGNTSCVEIRAGGKRLIFDGGTGLRALGQHLLKETPIEGRGDGADVAHALGPYSGLSILPSRICCRKPVPYLWRCCSQWRNYEAAPQRPDAPS